MIRRSSLRWRLVAWVTGVLLITSAAIFVVIYERASSELRSQIDSDVTGDANQLSQAVRSLRPTSPHDMLLQIQRYVRAQPFTGTSSLLFAVVPGAGTVSNHPELLGDATPDDGESVTEQDHENQLGHSLRTGSLGLTTRHAPDVGAVRVDEHVVPTRFGPVRIGAGEPLIIVTRAQRSIAKSFIIAGVVALAVALLASYLAGASVSLPLRRMAKVAGKVDDGDLHPRMKVPDTASSEIRVLAESFNHMLDRLAQAFAAQRDFIADASHELRTPMTVIAGQLEVLASMPHPDRDEVARVHRLVSAEIARTSRLVDDMLFLSRSERDDFLRLQELDLDPFVHDLWAGASVGENRRFELSRVPTLTLIADPDRVAQALRNLIANAIEHTHGPDGLVALEVELRPGGIVRFAVSDDGPGIAADERKRVFERFHRTDQARDRAGGGAGLGLAIVQAIAEAHGGTVGIEPSDAGGARFELDLPRARPPVSPRYSARPPASTARESSA
ncbi:MAG: HAMP domain-containing sensor histidine kinase [Solirubrobacteraceae bacterium]